MWVFSNTTGSFSNDDGNGNEHHAFLYIFSLSLHDYDVKMPNFAFLGERIKTSDDEFFFLFLNLSAVRTKSAPEEFAYI